MIRIRKISLALCLALSTQVYARQSGPPDKWIRPTDPKGAAVWGIHGGIVFSLWPYGVDGKAQTFGGGPRGLIRVGYEYKGKIYLINYIAIEPVVAGKMEFSEISPSVVDGKWGKLMWAGDGKNRENFYPAANSSGNISKLETNGRKAEELAVFVFMERFSNGASPYLKISIASDKPGELCFEIFQQDSSVRMERCALTATMGNYSRLRNLYLKGEVIHAKDVYAGFDGIDFIEKEPYPVDRLLTDGNGDYVVYATTDESFPEMASWPAGEMATSKINWRYRPPFLLTQYWRKEKARFDPSLHVRVNGRARYWSGGSADARQYMSIPGGPAFENFELRENYYPGQKFYFGLSLKPPDKLLKN